jgi:hypothetical protein
MGLTAIGISYSPWGKQSGAHINPSVTLTFFRLGKIAPWDALFYVLAQFLGGLAGVLLVAAVMAQIVAHPTVNFVATLPGPQGPWVPDQPVGRESEAHPAFSIIPSPGFARYLPPPSQRHKCHVARSGESLNTANQRPL